MFHFVKEGGNLHLGINVIRPCKGTAWAIKFRIPIWIYKKARYQQSGFGNILEGYKLLLLYLKIRKRKKRDFAEGVKLYLFGINLFKTAIGKQKLIFTEEQLWDRFDSTIGCYN